MQDPAELRRRLDGKAELILGDIAETIEPFVKTLTPGLPARLRLDRRRRLLGDGVGIARPSGPHDLYLPAVSFYFDDILFYFANEACGELAAIAEHNAADRSPDPSGPQPSGLASDELRALVPGDVRRAFPRPPHATHRASARRCRSTSTWPSSAGSVIARMTAAPSAHESP